MNDGLLCKAEMVARDTDVIILCVGERSVTSFGIGWDMKDSDIPCAGKAMTAAHVSVPCSGKAVRNILSVGKTVVMIEENGGRPPALGNL